MCVEGVGGWASGQIDPCLQKKQPSKSTAMISCHDFTHIQS